MSLSQEIPVTNTPHQRDSSLHVDIVCEVARFLDNSKDFDELKRIATAKISNSPPMLRDVFIKAAIDGDMKILQSLIKRGVGSEWLKSAALAVAYNNYDKVTIKFLIDNGMDDVGTLNKVLEKAAANDDLYMVEFLVSKGADAGASRGHLDIVGFLSRVDDLNTALGEASGAGRLDFVKFLRWAQSWNI